MVRKTSKEIKMSEIKQNVWTEPHLNLQSIHSDGYLRRILEIARLLDFVSFQPSHILPQTVAEFYLNMAPETVSTSITDSSTNTLVMVDLLEKATRVFHLRGEGKFPEAAGANEVVWEYNRFATDPSIKWVKGLNPLRTLIRPAFNFIAELVTKTIACHLGGHSSLTEFNVCDVSTICDSANGVKYNWANFCVHQLSEGAKDIKIASNPTKYAISGKLRYAGRISYALEQLFPNRALGGD